MTGILPPEQSDFGHDLAFVRNHAFQYHELRAGGDPVRRTLNRVADTEGAISGAIVQEFRFDFADEVAVQLLSRTGHTADDGSRRRSPSSPSAPKPCECSPTKPSLCI
jgi:hypothetical protein